MAYKLHYSDYPGTDTGPPDPERWVGPPGPPGPVGPQGPQGPLPAGAPFLPLAGGEMAGGLNLTATGGNTVRSVQDHFSDVINLADYGVATDALAAWNAALARLPAASPSSNVGIKIVLPAGAFSVHGGPITKTIPTNVTLTIEGQGMGVSTIYIGDDTDGLMFTLEAGAGVHMRGFSVTRGFASPASNHTAISVVTDPTLSAPMKYGTSSFRDLYISDGGGRTAQWNKGLVLSGLAGVPIDNVSIYGIDTAGTDNGDVMLSLGGPDYTIFGIAYSLTNCNIVGGSCGIDVTGYVQDVVLVNSSVIAQYDNVRWTGVGPAVNHTTTAATASGTTLTFAANSLGAVGVGDVLNGTNIPTNDQILGVNNAAGTLTLRYAVTGAGVASGATIAIQPGLLAEQLDITNCSFSASNRDIYCGFVTYVQVSNSVLGRLGIGAGSTSWTGVDLENCGWNNITGNMFIASNGANEIGVHIHVDGSAADFSPNQITGNSFTSMGTWGIMLSGVAANTAITGNTSVNMTGQMISAALSGNNAIIGNTFNGVAMDFSLNMGNGDMVSHVPLIVPSVATVPVNGDIQAAIDSLPASGGEIVLSPNTTYVITTAIASSKNNVRLRAPSWGAVIKRGPALAGTMLQLSGAGCLIEGMTFDGNGANNITGNAEVQVSGANSRITDVQVINSAGVINIAATGAGCRVDHCTITGMGTLLSTQRGYGIWGINHVPLIIEHNHITGTGIDGIGVDGPGTLVDGNYLVGCHTWVTGGGAQIGIYPNNNSGAGITCSNNFMGPGGSSACGAMEVAGNNLVVTGNTIVNQQGSGIGVDSGHGVVISNNSIRNCGLNGSGGQDGIMIMAGVTDFVITGNSVGDDQTTPTLRYCIVIQAGASDRYTITGNTLGPSNSPNNMISDGGTGANKVILNNTGMDTLVPAVYSAAQIALQPTPVSLLQNSGTLGITSISAASEMKGAVKVLLPNAGFTFTAGNNIANTVTTTANVPLIMVCDDGGKWWLSSSGNALPLTGGTVSGATTFSATGTALAVINNATVGGTLGVTGALSVGYYETVGAGSAAPVLYVDGGNTNTGDGPGIQLRFAGTSFGWLSGYSAGPSGGAFNNRIMLAGYSGLVFNTNFTDRVTIDGAGLVHLLTLQASTTYANDAAAATGGVPVGALYRNGSAVMIRVA